MSELRRYEILLPLKFNDGQPVPQALLAETVLELEKRFGAVSCETQIIHGLWTREGTRFRDDLVRVFVDVEDTSEARQFFRDHKETLKTRFQQLEIYMTTSRLDPV